MNDQELKEAERRRNARRELAEALSDVLTKSLAYGLDTEAAVIAILVNHILCNTSDMALVKLQER